MRFEGFGIYYWFDALPSQSAGRRRIRGIEVLGSYGSMIQRERVNVS